MARVKDGHINADLSTCYKETSEDRNCDKDTRPCYQSQPLGSCLKAKVAKPADTNQPITFVTLLPLSALGMWLLRKVASA
jgi:hypothetical protein